MLSFTGFVLKVAKWSQFEFNIQVSSLSTTDSTV